MVLILLLDKTVDKISINSSMNIKSIFIDSVNYFL